MPKRSPMKRVTIIYNENAALSGIIFFFTVILCILSLIQFIPPSPSSVDAPKDEFSARRAWKHLEVIAKEPHPSGSRRQQQVYEYLVGTLASLGLEPETQSSAQHMPNNAVLKNILARINGENPDGAIILIAHYDSVTHAPGATDNGSGVVSLLEVTRALQISGPYKNDIIILLTDAEEAGLIGARTFVKKHPWFKDVAFAINLEMATTTPVFITGISSDNGWIIQQYARSTTRPFASSILYNVHSYLGYGDDLMPFLWANIPGIGFSTVYIFPEYHTKGDSLANADIRSIQHQGEQTLAFLKHLAQIELVDIKEKNRVNFNLWGPVFIHYPQSLVIPMASVITLLLLGFLIYGFIKRKLRFRFVGFCALLFLLGLFFISLLISRLSEMMKLIIPGENFASYSPHFKNDQFFIFVFVLLAISLTLSLLAYFMKRTDYENILAAAMTVWLTPLWISSIILPDSSYIFTWPFLFFIVVVFSNELLKDYLKNRNLGPFVSYILRFIAVLPAILLIVPLLYLFYLGTALEFVSVICAFTFLLTLLYLPLIKEMISGKVKRIVFVAIGLTVLYYAGNMIYYYYFA
ncbi:hypothetical protein ES703_35435 [subsurface metagenome]